HTLEESGSFEFENGWICMKMGIPNVGYNRDLICRTWGQYNYETFDGLYYYYPGNCTYTLVRECQQSEHSFLIQIHNDPACKSSSYSCQRSVSLYFPYEGEILLQKYQVIHDGQSVQLPFERGNVKFEKIAGYILATQHREFSLAWDGTSGVYIKMTPEYAGRTCGLCGNFNGDMQDDLYTSYDKIAIFGNSWMENSPGQKSCHITPINYSPPCSEQNPQIIKNIRNICAILLGDPFTRCHHYVSPYPFVASCLNDLCMFGADDATLCGVLTEYARSCAQADHPLHEWRKLFSHCVMTCEGEFVFRECIDCCPASCEHEKVCIDSEFQCLDGCYCPEGSICIGGTWNCTDHICPAECSVTGDIHFMTFDKRAYTFQATCQYILAKSRHSGKFAISLQDTHCGTVRKLHLSLCIKQQRVREGVMGGRQDKVYHGNQYRLITELSSVFVQVKTDFGLRLQYDREGRRLYIEVDGRWKEDTVGLCGTFNGNIQDDFLSAAGMVESTPQLFANSWRISGGCNPSTNIPEVDPCDMHQQAASYATEKCSMMTGELFAPCHQYLSPELYHHQCKADTCKCGESCMCSSLAHYARQCRKHGVVLDFRPHVSECALQCPDTMVYGTCVSFCNRRCQSLSAPETCAGDCAEGCSCPDGTYHSSRAHACVKKSECPCYFLGAEYSPGEVTIQSIIHDFTDIQCPPGQVYFNCSHSHSETELSRGPECKKTCENLLLNITCSEPSPCLSGCVCPPGLVRHEDECFKPDECPCLWKGKEYFPGDLVTSPCHSCVCQQGTFQCTFQPCPSMCTAYGDRHYKTFDGLLYDFIGACKVYLVKNPSSVIDPRENVHVWKAGSFTVVHFPTEEITLLWDQGTTIHVQVGPRWQGKLSGLCGNFDSKTANEMKTPDHMESPNPQEFGNSWTAMECVNSPDIRNPCNVNPLREPFAKKECGILLSSAFELCHPVVDVTWFYSNCLTDTCACNRGGDCQCFCTSVLAYAHLCCQHGVPIDWRSPTVCREYLLGNGPYTLVTYLDKDTVVAADSSGGVFPATGEFSSLGIMSLFMLTPGLYSPKLQDGSLVSLEAADRPNYFLRAGSEGSLHLTKWQKNQTFHREATFTIHRDAWVSGFNTFESYAKPGFFVHQMKTSLHLMRYNHSEGFRHSTLFRLADILSPAHSTCEWRYETCASPCFRTCRDPTGKTCLTLPNVEGCVPRCPHNMMLDEDTQRCVYPEDCNTSPAIPSTPHALPLPNATTVTIIAPSTVLTPSPTAFTASRATRPSETSPQQDDCIQHICVDGHLIQVNRSQNCQYNVTPPSCGFLGFAVQVNGDKCCPQWDCPCRCSIFANLHVITFDGSYFGISGAASYVVVSLMNETVTVETSNCFSQWPLSVSLQLIVNSRYGYTPFRRFDFEIVDTGSMYTILTPAGVSIQWFHSTGIMVIETGTPNKKLTTVGLCGYCDGNPTNDLTLKNGTVLKETDDPVTFVDDWTVPSTRTGMRMSRRLEVNCTTSDCSECFRMLRNETFSVCHSQVSPEMFCELWVRDSVFVSNPCSALAAYVAVCNKFNICIEWRKSDYCPFLCPAHLMYQACVPTCEAKTCQNRIFFPSEDSTCSILSEGCVCPQGTILHRPDSTLCVPEEKCACTDSWGLPRAAGETWSASLDGCCTYRCLENGTINTVDLNCSSVPELACHRLGEVMVNLASDRSCCPQKICGKSAEKLPLLPQVYWGSLPHWPLFMRECWRTIVLSIPSDLVCGSCSDEIPSCQEGEILTVNDTTTEKCCPSYHCGKINPLTIENAAHQSLCETYRCPEFKCPHGTKMVQSWRPDQCCPLRSCVNDHVCVDGGRGVLRPGQTIVEHMADSVCHTTQCTHHHDNVTGFYQLIVTAVNCSSHCNTVITHNQVYIPPTDLTRCCGICKNISCLFNMENGTTAMFEVRGGATSWMFNCVMHNCTEMASGPTLIISPLSCPPFNETECLKVSVSHHVSHIRIIITIYLFNHQTTFSLLLQVNIVSCDGKCPSASIYNYSINTHARFCKCCREIGLQKRTVQLYCSGNSTWVNYTIQEPTECSCQWS
uniref:Otogelin n=1 Tax=Callorhinchus milii TaxID=7868 RepID=A0A4W3IMB4_CALMI